MNFGYGLSYTNFTFGTVSVIVTNTSAFDSRFPTGKLSLGGHEDLWDEVVQVTTSTRNTGSVNGAQVIQLYVDIPTEAAQPKRVLRGFEKVRVSAGMSEKVTFSVRRRDLSYWDTAAQKWAIANGRDSFSVGASSRDIHATVVLDL
ncbi:Glycoside hydrolase superfamily [Penicillium longicatenatum]|uniref:Glycoside hydrolase superfamily n=1 Tax=Penicillium longicatenatum TaxID=1561947 RepID=UPI002549318F|nr:Glycoside hydrolase superfamily [Penicillium longicatenatum]KAJ5651336.1 Glycoside hydrolase superfamily [Penicillium longicatenatum]